MAVKQRRVSDDKGSHDRAVTSLRKKLEEKDDELKEVAKRMQQWKLTERSSIKKNMNTKNNVSFSLIFNSYFEPFPHNCQKSGC